MPPEKVIDTDPPANSMASAGDDVAINVSTGPEQREVPDCAALSAADCTKKLKDAGFGKFKQTNSASKPEDKDRVLSTVPPANQLSAITNEITIVIGSGPQNAEVPVVAGQTVDVAGQILTASGFLKTVQVPTDSTEPSGQVIGTDPAERADRASGHPDPDQGVQGQPVRDAGSAGHVLDGRRAAACAGLAGPGGWTRAATSRTAVSRRNAVVSQSPAPGSGVNFGATITLSFAS